MARKKKKVKIQRPIDVANVLNKERIVMVFEEITDEFSNKFIKELLKLDHLSNAPIKIYINSPGGDCTAGLAMIDAMNVCRSRIITVVFGMAASMAGIISICGDERYMTENAYWMGHPMTAGDGDYMPHLNDRVKWYNVLNNKINKILRDRTSLNSKELHKCEHGELWLTSEQALEKNVCDKMLEAPLVKLRVRAVRSRKKKNGRA